MKKRVISALLCTAMVASMLAGCGKDDKKSASSGSKDGKYEDFITVDVYDEFANYQGLQSGWFAKNRKRQIQYGVKHHCAKRCRWRRHIISDTFRSRRSWRSYLSRHKQW